ncbi:DUF2802 domain-containing protein [Alteromonas sp. CYL-A6]|uniref:DUF2802 domain-containing protein n=1 Tax=Alteromonas nitratireducens TaxID=3390813 RepID=UPI0034B27506
MSAIAPHPLILTLVLLLVAIATVIAFKKISRQVALVQSKNDALMQSLGELRETLSQLQHQQNEDQTRVVVATRHLSTLEDKLEAVEQQIRDVKLQDPSMRLYQRAAELVKQGASMEEVMEACDIPRAEAELLITVHRRAT